MYLNMFDSHLGNRVEEMSVPLPLYNRPSAKHMPEFFELAQVFTSFKAGT